MTADQCCILTINGGSSTIKFAIYQADEPFRLFLHGNIDRIGLQDSKLTFIDGNGNPAETLKIEVQGHRSAVNFLIDWLEKREEFPLVRAIGHRVVQGINHTGTELITPELLDELHRIISYDPDHLPNEIELIGIFGQHHPKLPQVACFDTTFHSDMPRLAKLLPIPRRFDQAGIQRYGFHGLSCAYLMEELARVAGLKAAHGRVILAHLGNGASLTAVRLGKSIDTSMGFTPAGGLVMGTRPGDLDPGIAWYLMKSERLTPKQFNNLINHECGLLGISETSSDMNDLLLREPTDLRAEEAVGLFCYSAKKWIGAFAAALGGLDTLVFAGGIGENSAVIRTRICEGLGFLGIELEENQNRTNAPVVSKPDGKVTIHVMHTNEEWMIAKTVSQMINFH